MSATNRATVAIAALVVLLVGCGQASGGQPDTGTDTEATGSDTSDGEVEGLGVESDPTEHQGHDEHDAGEPTSPTPDAGGPGSEAPATAEEIAAAFNAHSGAHASHADAGEAREFPTGIDPAHLRIPAIDVDATITELSLAGAEPEVPQDFDQVGWYVQTRQPGEIGPAVLAGHVDSRSGPAVFVDLGELEPGDEIIVADRAEGERRFIVDELAQYPKDALPDEAFGFGAPTPQLRLITCGGEFDRSSGHYRDNIVVYASLTDAS